jgi:hypothetical protein
MSCERETPTTAPEENPMTVTRQTVRVYVTAARSGRPSRTVIHAFCPCTLPKAVAFEGPDVESATAFLVSLAIEDDEYCKRSAIPEASAAIAEPESTDTDRIDARQIAERLTSQPADAATGPRWVELTVSNMDNAGAQRRDGLALLIGSLGGACDAFGVKNASGSGIYSFAIRALVPAAVADVLPMLADQITEENDYAARLLAKSFRAELKAKGASAREIVAQDAKNRRDVIAFGISSHLDRVHGVMTASAGSVWTRENATVLAQIAAAVKDAAHARRTAAKAARAV